MPHHVQQFRTLIAVWSRRNTTRNWVGRFQPSEDSLLQNDLPCRSSFHHTALNRQCIIIARTHTPWCPPCKLLNPCAVDQIMIELAIRSLTRIQPVVSLAETLGLCILCLAVISVLVVCFLVNATSREHRPPFSIPCVLLPVTMP